MQVLEKEEIVLMFNNNITNTKWLDSYDIIYKKKEDITEIIEEYQYYIEKWHRNKYEKKQASSPHVTNITNINNRGSTTVFTYITQFVIYIVEITPDNIIEPITVTVNIQLRKMPHNRTTDSTDYQELNELSKKIKKRVYLDNHYSNKQVNKEWL